MPSPTKIPQARTSRAALEKEIRETAVNVLRTGHANQQLQAGWTLVKMLELEHKRKIARALLPKKEAGRALSPEEKQLAIERLLGTDGPQDGDEKKPTAWQLQYYAVEKEMRQQLRAETDRRMAQWANQQEKGKKP